MSSHVQTQPGLGATCKACHQLKGEPEVLPDSWGWDLWCWGFWKSGYTKKWHNPCCLILNTPRNHGLVSMGFALIWDHTTGVFNSRGMGLHEMGSFGYTNSNQLECLICVLFALSFRHQVIRWGCYGKRKWMGYLTNNFRQTYMYVCELLVVSLPASAWDEPFGSIWLVCSGRG